MIMSSFLHTSESVSEGHPDKIADRISDSILDEILKEDPNARVAIETFLTGSNIIIGGEVATKGKKPDVGVLARKALQDIGYTKDSLGIDPQDIMVQDFINEQSPDIAQAVNKEILGAGDQGFMVGYACDHNDAAMPMPIMLAHKAMAVLTNWRKRGICPYLRPDAKSQFTVEYRGGRPRSIDTVVISTQHDQDVEIEKLREDIQDMLLDQVIPPSLNHGNIKFLINPSGRFVVGGPKADAGLTGRKIIVDSYGGFAPHGGGAFSGKDATKVDRSGAYMARYLAKNIVRSGLARECEVHVAYAIGCSKPVALRASTFGTSKVREDKIAQVILDNFDLSVQGIIDRFGLQRPIFSPFSALGHFGRAGAAWEQVDLAQELKALLS